MERTCAYCDFSKQKNKLICLLSWKDCKSFKCVDYSEKDENDRTQG